MNARTEILFVGSNPSFGPVVPIYIWRKCHITYSIIFAHWSYLKTWSLQSLYLISTLFIAGRGAGGPRLRWKYCWFIKMFKMKPLFFWIKACNKLLFIYLTSIYLLFIQNCPLARLIPNPCFHIQILFKVEKFLL